MKLLEGSAADRDPDAVEGVDLLLGELASAQAQLGGILLAERVVRIVHDSLVELGCGVSGLAADLGGDTFDGRHHLPRFSGSLSMKCASV
jgi:hypothetical protein